MRKQFVAIIAAGALASGAFTTGAFAQATSSHNPAVKDSTVRTTAVAAKGSNSFTEAQARGRLAKAGFAGVSKLTKDGNGVWRGTATKGGAKTAVALDYKGNVTTR